MNDHHYTYPTVVPLRGATISSHVASASAGSPSALAARSAAEQAPGSKPGPGIALGS